MGFPTFSADFPSIFPIQAALAELVATMVLSYTVLTVATVEVRTREFSHEKFGDFPVRYFDITRAGWWFGTFLIFPYTGNVVIPIDFHIFQRG